jgi:hypothetical protein
MHVLAAAFCATGTVGTQCIADMICLAFFFLLRPGEYTGTTGDNCPFLLRDVQLFIGQRRLSLVTASLADLGAATRASLTFTDQKNGVRGEVISHSRSGSPLTCPVLAIIQRVTHLLREHHAPLDTPLASYYNNNGRRSTVSAKNVTDTLRISVVALGPALGFLSKDVSARSLRAGGATVLLCADVDAQKIRMLGRWQSDAMLRYLHLQAQPVMRNFSRLMLAGGNYVVEPGQYVPMHA